MKLLDKFENIFSNIKQTLKQKKLVRKYKTALTKTQKQISDKFIQLSPKADISSADFYKQLEEILITADIDYETTVKICNRVRKRTLKLDLTTSQHQIEIIVEEILLHFSALQQLDCSLNIFSQEKISCYLFCGVNGSGKTTTIVKLARLLQQNHKRKVMLIAADIFRHGAIEQLATLAKRNQIPIYIDKHSKHPSSVVFQGIKTAQKHQCDVVLIDTSGRLHNNNNLLNELAKVKKTAQKCLGYELAETLLIIDATNGQATISQIAGFNDAVGVSGLVLTKLDSSANGGAILSAMERFQIPTKIIGVGEKVDDIEQFELGLFLFEILKCIKI